MITKFDSLDAGHVDMDHIGYGGTAVNDRSFPNERLVMALEKARALARLLDRTGYDTFWIAEHHMGDPRRAPYAGLPTIEDAVRNGAYLCGPPALIIDALMRLEEQYPGLERVSMSHPIGTPEAVVLEQLEWLAADVMPAFTRRAAAAPA